jgi:hypothetical protein
MAYVGFLILGKGSNPSLSVTITASLVGAGMDWYSYNVFSTGQEEARAILEQS